jgi:2-keto-myo-inositol isomerase
MQFSRRKLMKAAGIGALSFTLPQSEASRPAPATPAAAATFKYSLNTSTISGQKLGIVKELETAAKAGYNGVEIWIGTLREYTAQGHSLGDLKKRIDDLGISIENAIGFAEWIVDDDTKRGRAFEQAKTEMEMLAQIGCKRTAAPPAGATQEPGLNLSQAAERYRALLQLGEQTGVMPQLELWGFSANLHTLGQVMMVALESGHPGARILPDVFHLYKGMGNFNGLELISGHAIEVFHMNDYTASPARAAIKDSDRIYPGDGIAPLNTVIKALSAAGGEKVLSLELFNKKYWAQDPLEVARTGLSKMKDAVAKATGA